VNSSDGSPSTRNAFDQFRRELIKIVFDSSWDALHATASAKIDFRRDPSPNPLNER
jgi:hypothetical protein